MLSTVSASCIWWFPPDIFGDQLQKMSTKYCWLGDAKVFPTSFLLHYDVYCLLRLQELQDFMYEPHIACATLLQGTAQSFRAIRGQCAARNGGKVSA